MNSAGLREEEITLFPLFFNQTLQIKTMKKTFFIIPGLGHNTQRRCYRALGASAREKGYEVVNKNPNWKRILSEQIFPVSEHDIIFGFSLGAVLACMIGQKYNCEKIILASMTPLERYSENQIAIILKSPEMANDLKSMSNEKPTSKTIKIYGDLEKSKGNITVENTGHELTDAYLKTIIDLL